VSGGGIFVVMNIHEAIDKYIELSNEAGYNSIFDRKRREYWEMKEQIYDRVLIRLLKNLCKNLKKT